MRRAAVLAATIVAGSASIVVAAPANAVATGGGCAAAKSDYYGTVTACVRANSNGSLVPYYTFKANGVSGCTSIQVSLFDSTTLKTLSITTRSCTSGTFTGTTSAAGLHGSFFSVVHAVSKGSYFDSPTLKE